MPCLDNRVGLTALSLIYEKYWLSRQIVSALHPDLVVTVCRTLFWPLGTRILAGSGLKNQIVDWTESLEGLVLCMGGVSSLGFSLDIADVLLFFGYRKKHRYWCGDYFPHSPHDEQHLNCHRTNTRYRISPECMTWSIFEYMCLLRQTTCFYFDMGGALGRRGTW